MNPVSPIVLKPDQRCPKCNQDRFYMHELRGSSGGISAYFDLDLAIFTAVSCRNCHFTEFYNLPLEEMKQRYSILDEDE